MTSLRGLGELRSNSLLAGLVVGVCVFALSFISDVLVIVHFPSPGFAAIDDVILGLFAGLLTMAYEQRYSALLREKLGVVSEMNHVVRNELEVIGYSAYATRNDEHIARIQHCLNRIDWALREVLPGRSERVQIRHRKPRSDSEDSDKVASA